MRFRRLARDRARVRLLDTGAFAPFTRNGLRLALWWLLMWGAQTPWVFFLSLNLIVGEQFLAQVTVLYVIGLSVTAVAVVLPTFGVHRRLAGEKAAELGRVRASIEAARVRAFEDSETGTAAAGRLPGLLAYERRIEAVSSWPIDASNLRRLGLYLLIPLASWVGAAHQQVPARARPVIGRGSPTKSE